MFTPSGRFQPDKKICFSMSDFHPGSVCPILPCTPTPFSLGYPSFSVSVDYLMVNADYNLFSGIPPGVSRQCTFLFEHVLLFKFSIHIRQLNPEILRSQIYPMFTIANLLLSP
jgi:hypothetical protein